MRILKQMMGFLLAVSLYGAGLPAAAASGPEITAYSAIVMDYETGAVLFEKDADTMQVPASMTKVMTAYIIFEELEAGRLTLETQVPVSANAAKLSRDAHYPSCVPLTAGEMISVNKLLELIMVPSASASCVVMAEYISGSEEAFVWRMNDTAARLGLTAAYENCHGAKPHYITARSQAVLVREFIRRFPQILHYTSLTKIEFNGDVYSSTNHLLPGAEYAYEGADGFKTGTIKAAGYCLSATAQRGGRRLISVVMHAKDTAARHMESTDLLNYGFQLLAAPPVQPEPPVQLLQPEPPVQPVETDRITAREGSQLIEINGIRIPFQTYILLDGGGNGTNYVKLRDIAYALNGSELQFSVGYSDETGITLHSGSPYQNIGTEMELSFSGADRECIRHGQTLTIDGEPVQMDCLTLLDGNYGGHNYFKLRDLGTALGFTVGFDGFRGVYVETK